MDRQEKEKQMNSNLEFYGQCKAKRENESKPEVCNVVNGYSIWLDEQLPSEKKEAIIRFIKAITAMKTKI